MEEVSLEKLSKELETIKKIVLEMQEYLEDCFLNPDEQELLEESRRELKDNETTPLEDLKKELDED